MVGGVDFQAKKVLCLSADTSYGKDRAEKSLRAFEVKYDYLVLAHGARANTLGIPGVEENAFFLREIYEARAIRRHLLQNIQLARLPSTSPEEMRRLLSVVVVGGGPTGVEFAGDLADFLYEDINKFGPALRDEFTVTLVEANEVLGSFDHTLASYGANRLKQCGVRIRKGIVKEVREQEVVLTDGDVIPNALVVWSTGVGPAPLTQQLDCDLSKRGRLCVDLKLRVLKNDKPIEGVYAAGDCAAYASSTQVEALPTLAAVASRQGKYLANSLNILTKDVTKTAEDVTPFEYKHKGSMATLGRHKALVEIPGQSWFNMKGFRAWLTWRSAYFTMLGNLRCRLYVSANWLGSGFFGRDTTYIADVGEVRMLRKLVASGYAKNKVKSPTKEEEKKEESPPPPAQGDTKK
jgi:NADH dehydrogenase